MISRSMGGRTRFAVTDRHGGVSIRPYGTLNLGGGVGDDPQAVAENRRRVALALGLRADRVVTMRQVHGDHVEVVDEAWDGEPPEADALVTAAPGLGLLVLVADCVPVMLADPVAGVVAVAHAGRRGVGNGVVLRTLAAMQDLGALLERTGAWLGPSVCGSCYEVPEAMRDEIVAVAPTAAAVTPAGTPALDLRRGLAGVLGERGVRVEDLGVCTAESPDHFSYRRDATTGRFGGIAWLVP